MDNKYTYSFIIPHKNCPDLLKQCVDSIPVRDDIQIIVVDDNSDEGKRPALSERTGLEVVWLNTQQSKGAGKARNIGLAKAKGKWLLFPDSDDSYLDGFLDVLDGYNTSGFDVIYFNYEFRDGKTCEKLPPHSFQKYFIEYDGNRQSKDQIRFRHNVPWTKMVLHSYLKSHNIIFEETPNGNDILFSMRVGYYTDNIMVEKQPLYIYMRNENSILTTKESTQSALCRITHQIKLNYFYNSIGYPQWRESLIRRLFHYSYTLGLPFVFQIIKQSLTLLRERKEWADDMLHKKM